MIEPSLNRVTGYQAAIPLTVADGRPVGTTVEWRAEASFDFSKIFIGRFLYRGRAIEGRETVHRADVSVEATF